MFSPSNNTAITKINNHHYWCRKLSLWYGFLLLSQSFSTHTTFISSAFEIFKPTYYKQKYIHQTTYPIPIIPYFFNQMKSTCIPFASKTNNDKKTQPFQIEVEQKFALSPIDKDGNDNNDSSVITLNEIESTLKRIGFAPIGDTVRFQDTYMEVQLDSNNDNDISQWILTANNDHWLRYRKYYIDETKSKSSWQLKRRPPSFSKSNKSNCKNVSIYEELEGASALQAILSILNSDQTNKVSQINSCFNSVDIPPGLPQDFNWISFASFETRRSSWMYLESKSNNKEPHPYKGLKVDLDGTDFGYMVGEVEAIVYDESEVEFAKGKIQRFISELTLNNEANIKGDKIYSKTTPVYGKLETFMMCHCPKHYESCVQAGCLG